METELNELLEASPEALGADRAEAWTHRHETVAQTLEKEIREVAEMLSIDFSGDERRVSVSDLAVFAHEVESSKGLRDRLVEMFLFEEIEAHVRHYDHALQSLAEQLEKKVLPIEMQTQGLRLWTPPYHRLFQSFIHYLRNAMDHGIEHPEIRHASGKPLEGRIAFKALKSVNELEMVWSDDGKGIDPEQVRKALVRKGWKDSEIPKDDHECLQVLMKGGVSTRTSVTATSGRGVGMGAIAQEAAQIGGQAVLYSQLGKGTELRIRVPWKNYQGPSENYIARPSS